MLPAVRGQIRDRKGKVLARSALRTTSTCARRGRRRRRSRGCARCSGMNGDEAIDVWDAASRSAGQGRRPALSQPTVLVAEDISREAMAAIETGVDLPGVKIVSGPRRSYPFGAEAAHVLGYMNEISGEELRAEEGRGLSPGRSGRANRRRAAVGRLPARPRRLPEDGGRSRAACPRPTSATSSRGRATKTAVPGNNVVLTLDADVQKIAERALRGASAAGVGGHGRRHRADPGDGLEAGVRSQRDVGPPDAGGASSACSPIATSRCTTRRWARPTTRGRRSRRCRRSRRWRTG